MDDRPPAFRSPTGRCVSGRLLELVLYDCPSTSDFERATRRADPGGGRGLAPRAHGGPGHAPSGAGAVDPGGMDRGQVGRVVSGRARQGSAIDDVDREGLLAGRVAAPARSAARVGIGHEAGTAVLERRSPLDRRGDHRAQRRARLFEEPDPHGAGRPARDLRRLALGRPRHIGHHLGRARRRTRPRLHRGERIHHRRHRGGRDRWFFRWRPEVVTPVPVAKGRDRSSRSAPRR